MWLFCQILIKNRKYKKSAQSNQSLPCAHWIAKNYVDRIDRAARCQGLKQFSLGAQFKFFSSDLKGHSIFSGLEFWREV